MPIWKGGFSKIGLYADVFFRYLFTFKFKTAKGSDTVNSLQHITQTYMVLKAFLADGGPHFDCDVVHNCCNNMGAKLIIVAVKAVWLNRLLEGSNKIILNALKKCCTPNLGKDDYEAMEKKDIPNTWPDHLDTIIKELLDCILPSLEFSPNELFFGQPTCTSTPNNPEALNPPCSGDVALHFTFAEQSQFDGYSMAVDHVAKRNAAFDTKVMKPAPQEVVFLPEYLVQVHTTEWTHTVSSM